MKRRDLLLAAGLSPLMPVRTFANVPLSPLDPAPPEAAPPGTGHLVAVAEHLKPALRETLQPPLLLVRPVAAPSAALRWRMESEGPVEALAERVLKKGDVFTLDFGGHRTGYLSFRLVGVGRGVDAPARLRITFGEVPTDIAEPFYPYKGGLSSAWLPDEVVNVDYLPQDVRLPRRYAFRYVKVEVLDTSANFGVQFKDIHAHAVTSADAALPPLPAGVPEDLRRIDEVAAATLRDCMQTTFEDGPRRDQRLWTGDLRVQALTNYATFNNTALVKRSLVSMATQAWLAIAGVASRAEGAAALSAAMKMPDVVPPRTPYLNHYLVDAMLLCGLRYEALDLVRSYWGGMVAAGADTFWVARRR